MGSGTTAEACVNTKRNWKGSEINPEYAQMTIDRTESLECQHTHLKIKKQESYMRTSCRFLTWKKSYLILTWN